MVIERFLLLGASGDLAARYLGPALAELDDAGDLPPGLTVTGLAREDWDDERLRRHLGDGLRHHAGHLSATTVARFLARLRYVQADVTDRRAMAAALAGGEGPLIAYLALPPALFPPAIEALSAGGLPAGSRVVVEKPFGDDLASARHLNRLLHDTVPEDAVFRIDHFLGKQTVQNVLGVRFANRMFEPVWNQHHVARVDVMWDETLSLEGRAAYYDKAGALRDMVPNHLMQLLCLVAMEPPATLGARDLRDRKVEVLRAVRPPGPGEPVPVRGRYAGYADEPGVDPARGTETFVDLTFFVDTWRWAGVPFRLRTGKALAADRHRIDVWFKPVPHLAFGQVEPPHGNRLRFQVSPDRLALGVDINGAGDPFDLEHVDLACDLAAQEQTAYARLLLDVVAGDPTLSIRGDEAEESWRIVEPVLARWHSGEVPLLEYPAGSDGPVPLAEER